MFPGDNTGGIVRNVSQGDLGSHLDRPLRRLRDRTPEPQHHETATFMNAKSTKNSRERIHMNANIDMSLAEIYARLYHSATYDGQNGHKRRCTHILCGIQNHILSNGTVVWRVNILHNPEQRHYCCHRIGVKIDNGTDDGTTTNCLQVCQQRWQYSGSFSSTKNKPYLLCGGGAYIPKIRDMELLGYISLYHGWVKKAREPRDSVPKQQSPDIVEDVYGISIGTTIDTIVARNRKCITDTGIK